MKSLQSEQIPLYYSGTLPPTSMKGLVSTTFVVLLILLSPLLFLFVSNHENMMQTRKRVLINAFTVRALRDTFPPARGAGM